jgi:drug/metabolite transporter (DMT)-like permease
MGIAAPITAVLCAAIPTLFGAFTQGFPDVSHLIGFGLALAGLWLIARPGGGQGRPAGIGLSLIGGCGFGGFMILIAQVQPNAVFWPLVAARAASIAVQLGLAATGQRFVRPARHVFPLIALSGTMDAGGNVFFVLAEQAGRLDVASVLSSLYPATTVLLALLLLRERLKPWQLAGVLLALIAVPLIAAR